MSVTPVNLSTTEIKPENLPLFESSLRDLIFSENPTLDPKVKLKFFEKCLTNLFFRLDDQSG